MADTVNIVVTAAISRHAAKVGYISEPETKVAIQYLSAGGIVEPFGYAFQIAGCDDLCLAEDVGTLVAWWYLRTLETEPAFVQELSLRRIEGQVTTAAVLAVHPFSDKTDFILRFPSSSSVDRAEAEARGHLHEFFAQALAALDEAVRRISDTFTGRPELWALVPAEARAVAQKVLAEGDA